MSEQSLIATYKADFEQKTGRCLKIQVCTRWETACQLPGPVPLDALIDAIIEGAGWQRDRVFNHLRGRDSIYKRGLVYFILVTNRYSLLKIAALTDKEHTTIINAWKKFSLLLEQEPLTSLFLAEVMEQVTRKLSHLCSPVESSALTILPR